MSWEWQYNNIIDKVLMYGEDRVDRTGVGTRAIFGERIDIKLKDGFPAVTTKKLAWKAVISELLWFLSGSGNERELAKILHGTDSEDKKTIWTGNANAPYWKPKAKFPGDLGRVYGVQWRTWRGPHQEREIDQIRQLVDSLRQNPNDRRMIVTAWNPGELDQMALPPCHMMFQCFVNKNGLSLQMYQRSVDTMLGLPFNIASYALLTHMLAQVCGLEADRLILNLGDVHIYHNHIDAAKEQQLRASYAPPTIEIKNRGQSIDGFMMEDFTLKNYTCGQPLKMEMAV